MIDPGFVQPWSITLDGQQPGWLIAMMNLAFYLVAVVCLTSSLVSVPSVAANLAPSEIDLKPGPSLPDKDASNGFFSTFRETVDQLYYDGTEFLKKNLALTHNENNFAPLVETDKLRIVVPNLCDRSVKHYSGYINIAEDKHMFFESRSKPSTDPLVLWLNGGPGDSSATGLLFELGPCSVVSEGRTTKRNAYSWTNAASMIFLDQPVDVGFSYADPGVSVKNSADAAKDVYSFLQLFFEQFPEYSKLPFHVAGESYGGESSYRCSDTSNSCLGIYAPNIASVIWHANQALVVSSKPRSTHINLASVIIGNGIVDPYIQIPSIVDYVCNGPYPVYDDPHGPECTALRSNIPRCQLLIKLCNLYASDLTCAPASRYCRSRLFEPSMKSDLNWYDLRKKCDAKDRPEHCYERTPWVETWMNDAKVKAAIGVDPERSFRSFNMDMNRDFNRRGDGVRNAAKLLPELVDGGVRLLVYAGKADMMANYMGNERWVENLETKFETEFSATKGLPWIAAGSKDVAGEVRSAGGTAGSGGNLTFVTVFEAGHMVAHDQPAAALDLFTRWITNVPLS
ncbi:serine carboxypeptidase [Mycena sp. CBHHK59/15]|nr:serine carboxypeptidase [Mycena sp. CBHHK59/15]